MAIETKHREHVIRLREDDDTWVCTDIGIENKSLSAVKRKLDELNKSERRVDVEALLINKGHWSTDVTEFHKVKVTVLCEPSTGRGRTPIGETRECWIMDGKERSKINIGDLVPLSQEAALTAWLQQHEIAKKAQKLADDALKAIERHDAESLIAAKAK